MTKELNFLHSNTSEVSIVYNMKQQEKVEFQYLKFVDFKDLQSWDPKKYHKKENDLSGQVLFGEILSKRDVKWVKIEKDLEYPILGVRTYGKGVYLNRVSKGQDLKMKKYQIVEENDLFWCKVDTKNGAFGIVESDLAGSFGSTNMNVAKIDIQKVLPEYLQLLFSLPRFQQYLDSFITGTTNRKYISFDRLLNEVYLPLPTLEIQKQLVDKYNINIYHAENCGEKIDKLEAAIEDYLMDELGIEIVEKQKQDNGYKYLQFVEFKELDRWDIDFLLRNTDKNISKFNLVKYETIFKSLKNGIADRNYSKTGIKYLTVASIKNGSIKQDTIQYVSQCKDDDFLENGTLLITRKGTIGQSAIIKEDKQYVASSEIFIIKLDNEIINPDYFVIINNLEWTQNQFKIKAGGMTMPSISQPNLKSIEIPLPSLEVQEKIVAQIHTWKTEIKELKQAIKSLEKEAKEGFENGVFK